MINPLYRQEWLPEGYVNGAYHTNNPNALGETQIGRFGPITSTPPIQSQQSELSKVLDAYTKSQEAKKKATTRKAKKQSPLPRPGALGIGLGFDLLAQLFGAKPGAFLNPALQGFQVGAAYKNQQAEEDANTLAQQDLIDAETYEKQGQIYQREYEIDQTAKRQAATQESIDERQLRNQEAIADRQEKGQQAMLDRQAKLQKEIDDRQKVTEYSKQVHDLMTANKGSIPADALPEMFEYQQQLIRDGIPAGSLRPLFQGQTKASTEADMRIAYRKAKIAETEKLIPLKVKNITSTIDNRVRRTDAWIKATNERLKQGSQRISIANANLAERQKASAEKFNTSTVEKQAIKHVADLQEASAAAKAQLDIYTQAGYANDPDLKKIYDKALSQKAQVDAKLVEANKRIPRVQGMTRQEWMTAAEKAKSEGKDPTIVTRMLNEALRKFPK